jgi:hypothetical protein
VYLIALTIHSWLRWAALLAGIGATINAFLRRGDTSERALGRGWDWVFMLTLDLQVLFGLWLYFGLSPYLQRVMDDPSLAISNPTLRFWSVIHIGMMVIALIAVRFARVYTIAEHASPKSRNGRFIGLAVATVAMLIGIPWPGLSVGRPLFRMLRI